MNKPIIRKANVQLRVALIIYLICIFLFDHSAYASHIPLELPSSKTIFEFFFSSWVSLMKYPVLIGAPAFGVWKLLESRVNKIIAGIIAGAVGLGVGFYTIPRFDQFCIRYFPLNEEQRFKHRVQKLEEDKKELPNNITKEIKRLVQKNDSSGLALFDLDSNYRAHSNYILFTLENYKNLNNGVSSGKEDKHFRENILWSWNREPQLAEKYIPLELGDYVLCTALVHDEDHPLCDRDYSCSSFQVSAHQIQAYSADCWSKFGGHCPNRDGSDFKYNENHYVEPSEALGAFYPSAVQLKERFDHDLKVRSVMLQVKRRLYFVDWVPTQTLCWKPDSDLESLPFRCSNVVKSKSIEYWKQVLQKIDALGENTSQCNLVEDPGGLNSWMDGEIFSPSETITLLVRKKGYYFHCVFRPADKAPQVVLDLYNQLRVEK